MSDQWWDEGEYVCKPHCIDDVCRNAGRCMWPPDIPAEDAAVAGYPAGREAT